MCLGVIILSPVYRVLETSLSHFIRFDPVLGDSLISLLILLINDFLSSLIQLVVSSQFCTLIFLRFGGARIYY